MKPAKCADLRHAVICGALLLSCSIAVRAADLLEAGKPVAISGTHGKFDFLTIDSQGRRLLAAHTGNSSLDVIDLDKQVVTKIINTGAAQASAVDDTARRYYVSASKPAQLVLIDSEKLEIVGTVPLSGPADLLAFSAKTRKVYVGHDDGKELWVIDPAEKKVAATIDLPGDAPEDLGFDEPHRRLFQSLKTGSSVAVIDLATNKTIANWSTAPAKGPHGMAVITDGSTLLLAGANGKLVMLKQEDGTVLSSTEIGAGVDQVAFDPGLQRLYCASGTGKIIVVKVEKNKVTTLGHVTSSEGARSVAVDEKTHTVWIAYAKGDGSFVQPFTPAK